MRAVMAAVVSLVLALTGCTAIATTGPVEEVPLAAQPRGIEIAPEPPSADMTPVRLVEGFLQAMADPEGDYAIARQYLTSEAAARWAPREALVFDGGVTGGAQSAGAVGLAIGSLDEHRRYTANRQPFEHDFGLVQEQGQWRISVPTEGLLLTRYNFERYYSRVTLYFMSRVGAHVVPDPIHMPESLVTPNNVMQALFEGPDEDLGRSVIDALPKGTRLGAGGATIDQGGVVTVDLAGLPVVMGDDDLRGLGAQLLWTLTSVARFTGLVVTREGGRTLPIPGASANGVLELATQQGYQVLSRAAATDLFGVRRGRAGRITGQDEFEVLTGISFRVSDIAVSVDGASMAVINEQRTEVSIGSLGGPVNAVELPLSNLRSPQFVLGTLWVLGDDWTGTPRIATVDRGGQVQMVTTEMTVGRVQDFSVSPSRARILIIADVRGVPTLGIASLLGSNPVTATGWEPLEIVAQSGELLTDPVSPTWQAETSLAVAATSGGVRSVFTSLLDGSVVQDLGAVTGEIVDVTSNVRLGGGPVAVSTGQEVTWRYEARTRWTRLADDVSAVAYPG
ncbi:LpqB family beta-propeller domain-containing protein [Tessaracoccus lubricantis]|uniref:LpqB family beta-propeller domain-containing protein n=1 Tax=Tessaracoccus lubricantis TaxID=545543 RepID=A0ABP9FJQ6_9ACTN